MENTELLSRAMDGDINAFQTLFAEFQPQLKSYLYRMVSNRNDAEDLTHDTFIRAFSKLKTYRGESSLKSWVFQIGSRLALNELEKRKRWTPDVSEQAKALVLETPALQQAIVSVSTHSPQGRYDMREHIDTCFSCIGRNLPVEQQVAVLLKDVYDFQVSEIEAILDRSEGTVKYLLQNGRNTMTEIFEQRCALVNQNGVCHQCSELNGWLNPLQDQQEALMELDLVRGSKKYDREALYALRTKLVRAIDPLESDGADLQELLLQCNAMAMGETSLPPQA